jgi:hypothetical protein
MYVKKFRNQKNYPPLLRISTIFYNTTLVGFSYNPLNTNIMPIFCFCGTPLADFVDGIHRRTKDLQENTDFNEAYHSTLQQIVHYLHGIILKFPHEAVRCLFLLTDGDLDSRVCFRCRIRVTVPSFLLVDGCRLFNRQLSTIWSTAVG